jgi:hypothetical protein
MFSHRLCIGVYPFDVEVIQPDALGMFCFKFFRLLVILVYVSISWIRVSFSLLVCAAYKWLFGPYSIGFGYYSAFFDDGIPLEESWMNRVGSDNFAGLTSLQAQYRPLAQVCL